MCYLTNTITTKLMSKIGRDKEETEMHVDKTLGQRLKPSKVVIMA